MKLLLILLFSMLTCLSLTNIKWYHVVFVLIINIFNIGGIFFFSLLTYMFLNILFGFISIPLIFIYYIFFVIVLYLVFYIELACIFKFTNALSISNCWLSIYIFFLYIF